MGNMTNAMSMAVQPAHKPLILATQNNLPHDWSHQQSRTALSSADAF
jgi:hypothetical protein